jgi:hypothetical protein
MWGGVWLEVKSRRCVAKAEEQEVHDSARSAGDARLREGSRRCMARGWLQEIRC